MDKGISAVQHVELRNITKRYGGFQAVTDLSLSIEKGEFCALLGPSGCGKSTLLRMIAGLEEVTEGKILINGADVTDVPPAKRRIAMVFQSYALYPHLTVRQNIGFSLSVAHAPKAEIEKRTGEIARMLQLEPLLDRRPAQLSGGQRQRVAIGRALGARSGGLPVRRAAVKSRRLAARADAHRACQAAQEPWDDDDLCHPRPGGGDDAGRQDRRARQWAHRPDRLASRTLQQPGQQICRLIHRLAGDEFFSRTSALRRRKRSRQRQIRKRRIAHLPPASAPLRAARKASRSASGPSM